MKTKEEIIAVIEKIKSLNIALSVADYEAVLHYLKLSTINPMKIDEERFVRAWKTTPSIKEAIKYYNSTLEDHQVLQPLPENPPEWFMDFYSGENRFKRNTWNSIIQHYGTPTKKELVSVDELEKEFLSIVRSLPLVGGAFHISLLAQHIIDTYSLNPTKRDEFPFNLKKGDKLMSQGFVKTFGSISKPLVLFEDGGNNYADQCTPYTEPSIHDKFMASLSDEQKKMYEEMKEVKG